ncbi:MAG: hypothetical protein ABIH53_04490 [archaeon]
MDKHDEYLIVTSVVVSVLVSKIADSLLPLSSKYELLNSPSIDPWLGLLINIVMLVAIAGGILRFVKWVAYKSIRD